MAHIDADTAALALDLTHAIGERGPKTFLARLRTATALDLGRQPRQSDVNWLLRIGRNHERND